MRQIKYSSHAMTERLLTWCDEARSAGRKCRAEALLLLAWMAYDRCLAGYVQRG